MRGEGEGAILRREHEIAGGKYTLRIAAAVAVPIRTKSLGNL